MCTGRRRNVLVGWISIGLIMCHVLDAGSGRVSLRLATKNNDMFNKLIDAIKAGKMEAAVNILERNPKLNVNAKESQHGETPLQLASLLGQERVCRKLLGMTNIQVDLQEAMFGNTALIYAVEKGHLNIVRVLLQARADPAKPNNFGMTPLILASMNNHLAIVKRLLQVPHLPTNVVDSSGQTALLHAAAAGSDSCLIRLLMQQEDTDIRYTSSNGKTLLMHAAEKGDVSLVAQLLSEEFVGKVDINAVDRSRRSALLVAVSAEHIEIVKLLLEHKDIKFWQQDMDGFSALHRAIFRNNKELINLFLLKYGEKPDFMLLRSIENECALMYGIRLQQRDVLLFIFRSRTYSSCIAPLPKQFLHYVMEGDSELVQLFLQRMDHTQCLFDVKDEQTHLSAFLMAVKLGQHEIVQAIIDYADDFRRQELFSQRLEQMSALMFACQTNQVKVVESILKADAALASFVPNLQTNRDVFMYLVESPDRKKTLEVIDLMKKYVGDSSNVRVTADLNGQNAIIHAITMDGGELMAIRLIEGIEALRNPAYLNRIDESGKNTWNYARAYNMRGLMRVLENLPGVDCTPRSPAKKQRGSDSSSNLSSLSSSPVFSIPLSFPVFTLESDETLSP